MRTVPVIILAAVVSTAVGQPGRRLTSKPKLWSFQTTIPVETTRSGKQKLGVHRPVPPQALKHGSWSRTPTGHWLWRLAVRSPGAKGIRLHFREVSEGELWVYSDTDTEGAFTPHGPAGHGDFWTGVVRGDTVIIEFRSSRKYKSNPLQLPEISHLWQVLE
jgi:hypothetical protein